MDINEIGNLPGIDPEWNYIIFKKKDHAIVFTINGNSKIGPINHGNKIKSEIYKNFLQKMKFENIAWRYVYITGNSLASNAFHIDYDQDEFNENTIYEFDYDRDLGKSYLHVMKYCERLYGHQNPSPAVKKFLPLD